MNSRERPSRPKFGPVDPYCLLAVLPMLLVAGIMGAMISVLVGLVVAFFAGLVVVFDSWANRPAPAPARRLPEPARRRPATAWQPRPPAARPGGTVPRRAVPQSYYRR